MNLIEQARLKRAQVDEEIAAREAKEREERELAQIEAARNALTKLFGIPASAMTEVRGEWAGVEAEGMRFGCANYQQHWAYVRLIAPCPGCGELLSSQRIESLYDLAVVVDRIEQGTRYASGRPTWLEFSHDCPAAPKAAPALTLNDKIGALLDGVRAQLNRADVQPEERKSPG